ncbi:translation-associated element 2 [Novymonas esmeraldas]|uniref:Translation-associated element 2 n=1 Tax=Novymonas esmeraldas TaxID=1808958 RepID=A0AAW0EZD7_9TRYP
MVKQRMTALDVRATVEEMRASLIGLRLLNLYNINSKMFLFKFGHGENKKNVLLESGTRFHVTELSREKPKVPSQFTLKLRKHIRAWRLDSISQLQHDRTIDLCFGVPSTEGCFHIIIELFSKGNVILTDYAYKMMMLLRTHRDDSGLSLMVNNIYPVVPPEAGAAATSADAEAAAAAATATPPHAVLYPTHVDASGRLHVQHIADADLSPDQRQLKAERERLLRADWEVGVRRSDPRTPLQSVVAGLQHLGPDLAQHVLTVTGVASTPQRTWLPTAEDTFAKLLPGLLVALDLSKVDLTSAGGYLIRPTAKAGGKTTTTTAATAAATAEAVAAASPAPAPDAAGAAGLVAVAEQFESFSPILFAQYTDAGVESLHRTSFGRVCDEFFLITETERIDASNDKRKNTVKSKGDKFAADHARRINALETDMAANQMKGEQLILHADRVDEAVQLINGALATGISWDALRTLLKRRHAEGHPVAYMIHELFLERNSISVLLETALDEEEGEEDCDVPPLVVEVVLSKTAHANAANYFGRLKQHRAKLERTVAATGKAAAGAARKGAQKQAQITERKVIVKERQRHWWEKFFWFRTSAGDLALRGRDVQSTELLVRRVMRLGDLFIQCDVDGSLPCVLRPMNDVWQQHLSSSSSGGVGGGDDDDDRAAAPALTQPVALHSVGEVGAWCVAFSGAWESKQSTGSWWVYASQVTGGTASGTYLYSGERHHLPPQSMALGCGLLFYVARTASEPAAGMAEAGSSSSGGGGGGGGAPVTDDDSDSDSAAHGAKSNAESLAADPRAVLQRELPSLLSPSHAEGAAVAPDTAAALAELPTVEALRAEQRKQRGTYVAGAVASGTGGKGKTAKRNIARNSRVDHEALRRTTAATAAVDIASPSLEHSLTPSSAAAAAATATTTRSSGGGGDGRPSTLTRHQKKKLKKIQDKYGDQDDEDRLLGAQVNGNQLSRVQQLELQRRAEQQLQREEAAAAAAAAAAREATETAAHVSSAPPSRAVQSECDGDGSAADSVEAVSDFTQDDEGGGGAAEGESAGVDVSSETGEPQPDISAPTAAGARSDRDAAVAQQTAELRRAFPHYIMDPGPADVVQHVVPVCAPMLVVAEYACHAALCVGSAKKGVLAARLLEVFTARAEQGDVGSGAVRLRSAPAAPQRAKAGKRTTAKPSGEVARSSADASVTVAVNASVVKALQLASANDVVEQLRANVKTVDLRL